MVADYLVFVRELPKSFAQIGAMLPSSTAFAKLMVAPIRKADHPLTILEVGPGTGPFTRQIIELMGPEDRFIICEINPRFVRRLKKTLRRNRHYQRHKDRITFFQGPVQLLPHSDLPARFDVIVSSLPFVNFAPEVVDEILGLFKQMTRDGGSLTFCQYVGVCKIRELFSDRPTRTRVKGVEEVVRKWCDQVSEKGAVHRRVTFLNVPPAMAIEFNYTPRA
jgi:phospholipid N-methyltransferase